MRAIERAEDVRLKQVERHWSAIHYSIHKCPVDMCTVCYTAAKTLREQEQERERAAAV